MSATNPLSHLGMIVGVPGPFELLIIGAILLLMAAPLVVLVVVLVAMSRNRQPKDPKPE